MYYTNISPQLIPAVKRKVEIPDIVSDYEPSMLRKRPKLEEVLDSAKTGLPTVAIDPVMPGASNSAVTEEPAIPLPRRKGRIPSEAPLPLQGRHPVVSELTPGLDEVPLPLRRNPPTIPDSKPIPSEVPVPFSRRRQTLVKEIPPVEHTQPTQPSFLGSLLKSTGYEAPIPLQSSRRPIPVVPQHSEPSDDTITATTAQFQTIAIAPRPRLAPTPVLQLHSSTIPPEQFYGTGELGSPFGGFVPPQEPKKVVQFKVPLEEATPLHIRKAGGPGSRNKTLSPPEPMNCLPAEPSLVSRTSVPARAHSPDRKGAMQISSSSNRMSSPLSPLPPFPPTPGTATPESSPRWPIAIPRSPSTESEDVGVESEAVDELDSDDTPERMAIDEPSSTVAEGTHSADAAPTSTGSNPMLAAESLLRRFNAPESLRSGDGIGMSTAISHATQVRLGESFQDMKKGIDGLDQAKSKKKRVTRLLSRLLEAEMYVGASIDTLRDCLSKYGLDGQAVPDNL